MSIVGTGSSSTGWIRAFESGPAWCLAFAESKSGTGLAYGCADGLIRTADPETGAALLGPFKGHSGAVLCLASGSPDDPSQVASGGIDGTVRLWNLSTGTPGGEPLLGHTGGVRGVAWGGETGAVLLASSGADGTVRIWDPQTGELLCAPLKGHTGSVLSVAFGVVDGRTVLASAGDDATVVLWDPWSGAPLGDPMRGHAGGVRCVAFGQIDSRAVLASASDDGTIRLWDPASGVPLFGRLMGHVGLVRTVAFGEIDEGVFLASGGIDGTIRLWDPRNGTAHAAHIAAPATDVRSIAFRRDGHGTAVAVADGRGCAVARFDSLVMPSRLFPPEADRSAIVTADALDEADVFGRVILARHLLGVLGQLIVAADSPDCRNLVVSVDGRWGAGKTTLARLLVKDMNSTTMRERDANSSPGGGGGLPSNPIVVEFDAWREASIAPHWWALGSAVNRGVRRERSFAARIVMTTSGFLHRILSSQAAIAALVAAILALFGFMAVKDLAPSELNDTFDRLQAVLTGAAALFAAVTVTTRSLLWASPALGRLHLRSDDNPLGQVADRVFALRCWSPRSQNTGLGESAATAGAIVLGTFALRLTQLKPLDSPVSIQLWLLEHPLEIAAILGAGLLGYFAIPGGHTAPAGRSPTPLATSAEPGPVVRWLRRPWGRSLLALVLGGTASAAALVPLPTDSTAVGGLWVLVAVLGAAVAGTSIWGWRKLRRNPRRPILFIVDELDRCPADTVVAYLETVHTLLRGGDAKQSSRRAGGRDPAPLIVLVLADGRWIRAAFTAVYGDFAELGSPVRSLGGDFLQKLFDHTVLVPELNASHVQQLVSRITAPKARGDSTQGVDVYVDPDSQPNGTGDTLSGGRIGPGGSEITSSEELPIGDISTGNPSSFEELEIDRERAANQALADASPVATAEREAHLLTLFSQILPPNPRLIRRVANTWGMLEALKSHIGHSEPDETVVRAAILFVTFPSLVDQLLSEPDPPRMPARVDELPSFSATAPVWLRSDVLGVLARSDGTLVSPAEIARCFGKVYPRDLSGW